MRALFAPVLIVFGIAAATPAAAADLVGAPHASRGERQYSDVAFGAARTAPVVILDYEPGVITRAWWLSPWSNHYYFPATGKKPRLGRDENLAAHRAPPKPAESFYRVWSNDAVLVDDRPPVRSFNNDGVPRRGAVPQAPAKP